MSAQKNGFATFFQWFAWTISLGASVFFIIYYVDSEVSKILAGKSKELLPFLACLLVAVIGCVLSFARKTSGALLMFTGAIGMAAYLYLHGGLSELRMMIVYCGPYILAAFLLLVTRRR
jgi:hypothetical protein